MTEQEVVELMQSSKTEQEWTNNCDKVKAVFGNDYPAFWYKAIIASGLMGKTAANFGFDAEIHVYMA